MDIRPAFLIARKFFISPKGGTGFLIVMFFLLLSILQPLITHINPQTVGVGGPNEPPSKAHPLGTTQLGQDVLSQFLAGGLVSIVVGVLTGLFSSVLAALIGIPAGYFRGALSGALTLVIDVFIVIPILPLIIIFAVYLGPSILNQIMILTLLTWPIPARVVASQVLSLKERSFIESAIITGASGVRIMSSEILPNILPLLLSNGILVIVFAILFQAAIAFLGLGIPTQVSWGSMLYYAELSGAVASGEWWWVIPPGIGIMLLAFSFSLMLLQLDDVLSEWTKFRRI